MMPASRLLRDTLRASYRIGLVELSFDPLSAKVGGSVALHHWPQKRGGPVAFGILKRLACGNMTLPEGLMPTPLNRASLGFLAAVISVLIFHQGMWSLLHIAGLMPPPYPTRGVPPFGVPLIVDLCFWGGVWGAVFGLVLPWLSSSYPMWLRGLALGIAAALVGLFIVPLIKGLPIAGGWAAMAFVRSFLINGFWGIGVGLILPLLMQQTKSKPA